MGKLAAAQHLASSPHGSPASSIESTELGASALGSSIDTWPSTGVSVDARASVSGCRALDASSLIREGCGGAELHAAATTAHQSERLGVGQRHPIRWQYAYFPNAREGASRLSP